MKAPTVAALGRQEVQLWTVSLDAPPDHGQSHLACLSEDERERAKRYRFEQDRSRFVAARAALRRILGGCVGLPAAEVVFEYGAYGKPALAGGLSGEVQFNLSHCEGLALIAVTSGRRVGVDLERIRSAVAKEALAERFFSDVEVAALRALPPEQQDEAFFACWTRKEAYIKARGDGLSIPLDAFSVSLIPGEPPALLDCSGFPDDVGGWSLQSFTPAPGFVAALAVEGGDTPLVPRRFSEASARGDKQEPQASELPVGASRNFLGDGGSGAGTTGARGAGGTRILATVAVTSTGSRPDWTSPSMILWFIGQGQRG